MSYKPNTTNRITAVSEIMSEKFETINLLDSAKDAALKMTEKNVSSLLVVDDEGSPVGIVTERDLVRKVCTKDIPSQLLIIQNVISSPIKTISSQTPIDEVADLMVRNKIRHVVVAVADLEKKNNNNQEPLGIVSATDIVAYVRESGEAMAQISREVVEALAIEE